MEFLTQECKIKFDFITKIEIVKTVWTGFRGTLFSKMVSHFCKLVMSHWFFYNNEPLKKRYFLILPSRLTTNSKDSKMSKCLSYWDISKGLTEIQKFTPRKGSFINFWLFFWPPTLESGLNVAPWINVASGKFYKMNKRSPLKCANLCSKV